MDNSLLQLKWKEEKCPVEKGIFFPNGEIIFLSSSNDKLVKIQNEIKPPLLNQDSDFWIETFENPDCTIKINNYVIKAGGTAWEGDGFIAVEKNNRLQWILHIENLGPFISIEYEKNLTLNTIAILATSGEYPTTYKWHISLENPREFQILQSK